MNPSPSSIERYQRKARAVVDAWTALFGVQPSRRALARSMAVAEFETRLGDARGWATEHNWGAITKRPLSEVEQALLRDNAVDANGGEAALRAARTLLPAGPNEALHTDSSPGKGRRFTWFWAFATDAEAARKFLQVLVVQRPSVRAALEREDIRETARAMYETGYYEGFHPGDAVANIRDYVRRLAELEPAILHALGQEPVPSGAPSSTSSAPASAAPPASSGAAGTASAGTRPASGARPPATKGFGFVLALGGIVALIGVFATRGSR